MTIDLSDIQPLLSCFIKHKNVWANYDEGADTLYLHFKKPNNADHSEMTDDDIIIRYENNEVIGLTYLHASKRK
jgi:uncharacterized protein YuzE